MSALLPKAVITMPGMNEIRHHITAVEQTKKITNAMGMISSNRISKVMGHIEQNRLYFDNIRRTMKEILSISQEVSHPYVDERQSGHRTYVVMSGDKGMCGAHNSNVLKYAMTLIEKTPEASLITLGHTAEEYFHTRGMTPDITMLGIVQDPTLSRARAVAQELMQIYESGITDEIHIVFTSFYGKTRGVPVKTRILPIKLHDYEDIKDAQALSRIIYHPSAQTVFDMLVPQYVIGLVFGVMVQAYASEHFARMNAMHSATTNAQEMLKDLRIQFNLARQSAITNEIAEITGAAEILNPRVQ